MLEVQTMQMITSILTRTRRVGELNGPSPGSGRGYAVAAIAVALGLMSAASLPAAEGISNLRVSQRAGTNLVDIHYDLAATNLMLVGVAVSTNGGGSFDLPATHFTGDVGSWIGAGTNKWIVWDAFLDWPNSFSSNIFFRLTASDALPGMVLIPAGSFEMGDTFNEGWSDELPVHTVTLSAFYVEKYEVTKTLWDRVYQWAVTNGYSFENPGSGKEPIHPVQTVTWFDCVKWCNARSEKEGRTPAYYTSAEQTTVYRTGQVDVQNDWVKWNGGYRLPTEAEWEKAARGGAGGHRFPWADNDTIAHNRANYYSSTSYDYDTSPTWGYHPTFAAGDTPYTNPVGYFAPNGYGLYDMAGNVWEWCWNHYGSYSSDSQTNPLGPTTGSYRVYRGGSWTSYAINCRTAYHDHYYPTTGNNGLGFRAVLSPGR